MARHRNFRTQDLYDDYYYDEDDDYDQDDSFEEEKPKKQPAPAPQAPPPPKKQFEKKTVKKASTQQPTLPQESRTFNSLSDLVSSHLTLEAENVGGARKFLTRPLGGFGAKNPTDWHIDLSKALRSSKSAAKVLEDVESYEEETVPVVLKQSNSNSLHCSLDVKHLRFATCRLETVKSSSLGRIVHRKYYKKSLIKPHLNIKTNKMFSFTIPSPDDNILTKLRLEKSAPANVEDQKQVRKAKTNYLEQYMKERGGTREHLFMITVGHVDAGKSTIMGHMLWALGQINQRTMHKFETESKRIGKQSFKYAWVLDETDEERSRGVTMDVGRSFFETPTKFITLLDAPGHKEFVLNMIAGTAQADVALLVVSAAIGEFESGFDRGGQTREHVLLVRALGVAQLAVAVNKLDTVGWSRKRFIEIREKLVDYLKQIGFKESEVVFVPVSGLTGQNLVEKANDPKLVEWYNDGKSLLEVIDGFKMPERAVDKPFRMSISNIFTAKYAGGDFCVSGRVESGAIAVGSKILICPTRSLATVKSITSQSGLSDRTAYAGDQPTIGLIGCEQADCPIGSILCDPDAPVGVVSKFECRIVTFGMKMPIIAGYQVILHHQALVQPATITKLISSISRSTGEVLKNRPRFLPKNSSGVIVVKLNAPIALELYSDCKSLGRVTFREQGETIAAGLITKLL